MPRPMTCVPGCIRVFVKRVSVSTLGQVLLLFLASLTRHAVPTISTRGRVWLSIPPGAEKPFISACFPAAQLLTSFGVEHFSVMRKPGPEPVLSEVGKTGRAGRERISLHDSCGVLLHPPPPAPPTCCRSPQMGRLGPGSCLHAQPGTAWGESLRS